MNHLFKSFIIFFIVFRVSINAEIFNGYTLFSPTGGGLNGATGGTS